MGNRTQQFLGDVHATCDVPELADRLLADDGVVDDILTDLVNDTDTPWDDFAYNKFGPSLKEAVRSYVRKKWTTFGQSLQPPAGG